MKLFYYARLLSILILFQFPLLSDTVPKSVAVYYGKSISYPLLGVHDYIILDPDNVKTNSHGFKVYRDSIYAYVSINEVQQSRRYYSNIDKRWILGKNGTWNSKILDISNEKYQNFLLEYVFKKLSERGFKNYFFDTVDSYQIAASNKEDKARLKRSMISFIKKFKTRYPNSKLILNRGFELIDDIYNEIDAVLFESYYFGLDPKTLKYKKVSKNDRDWLDIQIKNIKKYKKDIIALDYLPANDTLHRKQDIKKLQKKGLIPCVAQKDLMGVSYSSKDVKKREVLILYDGKNLEEDSISFTNGHLFASLPLEYKGYIPVLKEVDKAIAEDILTNRYSAIIIWLERKYRNYNALMKWAKRRIDKGDRVLFLGNDSIDLNSPILSKLGIQVSKNYSSKTDTNKIVYKDEMIGYEVEPSIEYQPYIVKVSDKATKLLTYKNKKNQLSTIAAIMPWGGFVFDDALIVSFMENSMWIIDPFQLFTKALKLEDIPAMDPTTESGRRLLFVHVDGDGAMNRVEGNQSKFSIEVILDDFIKKYNIPQSISIIESEIAPYGMYPKISKKLEEFAAKIFASENVEPATHTYTHPLKWKKLEKDPTNIKYRIPVKNYTFSIDREIGKSLEYITKRLLPKGHKKANMIFWSGDCQPSENVINYIYDKEILNMNGGDTYITYDKPWLALIQPFGLKNGNYYQVYTGQQNENVYTNEWLGPFWGFKRVVQTFELTDKPRRFKPIDIYYHLYSGSKTASKVALKYVYDWALKQNVMPIFTSSYIPKVLDFYTASIAKVQDKWIVKGLKDLRTIRVDDFFKNIDIKKSQGVVGYIKENGRTYIHTDQTDMKVLVFSDTDNKNQNYLIESNARVVSKKGSEFYLKSKVPISGSFSLKKGCFLDIEPKIDKIRYKDNVAFFESNSTKEIHARVSCQK